MLLKLVQQLKFRNDFYAQLTYARPGLFDPRGGPGGAIRSQARRLHVVDREFKGYVPAAHGTGDREPIWKLPGDEIPPKEVVEMLEELGLHLAIE